MGPAHRPAPPQPAGELQAAWRGEDGGGETGAIHSEQGGAGDEQPRTSRVWADRFHLQRPVDLVHLRERMTT